MVDEKKMPSKFFNAKMQFNVRLTEDLKKQIHKAVDSNHHLYSSASQFIRAAIIRELYRVKEEVVGDG